MIDRLSYESHRRFQIACGDCRDLILSIPNNSVDLVILDPPYKLISEKWDKDDSMISFSFVSQLRRVMKDTASLYLWCGIGEKSQSLIRWFPLFSETLYFKDIITWKKRRGIGMRKGWLYTREEILWFVKNNAKFVWNKEYQYLDEKRSEAWLKRRSMKDGYVCSSDYKRVSNVWDDIPEAISHNQRLFLTTHFTPKPTGALDRIVKVHTAIDSVVLDPCFGSGSTGYSALRLGRYFVGFEKHKQYFDEAIPMLLDSERAWYDQRSRNKKLRNT